MKKSICLFSVLLVLFFTAGCSGKSSPKSGTDSEASTAAVPDTGYTGIKKIFSRNKLVKEVTYKNGVIEGETRTYYAGGQLYQTFNYVNGHKEDTARWYYIEGQVFRSTPFRNDTIDGIQKQFYRNGRLKAKIGYIKGLRTPFLEEYDPVGRLVRGYPEITYNIEDNYAGSGKLRVNLATSDTRSKVKFYRGTFTNGIFDSTKCESIRDVNGKYYVELRKTGTAQAGYLDIIASIITNMGNNFLVYKKIDLPYNDMK